MEEAYWSEKRSEKRTRFEASDTGHILETTLRGKDYRFKVLDKGLGGMGMLVLDSQPEVLKELRVGDQIGMTYSNPKGSILVNIEIRHITFIRKGPLKGHYKFGLSMSLS